VNEFEPTLVVLIALPFATGPAQVLIVDPAPAVHE
jgi:hypothetical protein